MQVLIYFLYGLGGLVAWLLFGYCYCVFFVDDEEDESEYQECPYD